MATVFTTKEETKLLKHQIEKVLKEVRNDILDGQDKIYKELKDFREEQSAHSFRHDDTEKRLRAIEAVPVIAHSIKR